MTRPAFRLFLAQSLDGLTFLVFMLAFPAFTTAEQNPIIGALHGAGGAFLVLAIKLLVGLGGAYLATHVKITQPRIVIILLTAATASGVAGSGTNIASLIGALT